MVSSISKTQTKTKAFPKDLFILSFSFCPENRLKKVEPPALHIRANAIIIYDKGKQTDNPANAEVPLKLPTNIRSTML